MVNNNGGTTVANKGHFKQGNTAGRAPKAGKGVGRKPDAVRQSFAALCEAVVKGDRKQRTLRQKAIDALSAALDRGTSDSVRAVETVLKYTDPINQEVRGELNLVGTDIKVRVVLDDQRE